MVSQCVENNRTDPLTYSCRWMHEGADLRSYVGGCVRSGTAHQKHKATCFARAFSALTDMRSEKHSHLAYCSWLTSNNGAFAQLLMTHMTFGAHTSKTRESTVNIVVSGSSAGSGTAFSHTLKHMPDLLVIETRIFVH